MLQVVVVVVVVVEEELEVEVEVEEEVERRRRWRWWWLERWCARDDPDFEPHPHIYSSTLAAALPTLAAVVQYLVLRFQAIVLLGDGLRGGGGDRDGSGCA